VQWHSPAHEDDAIEFTMPREEIERHREQRAPCNRPAPLCAASIAGNVGLRALGLLQAKLPKVFPGVLGREDIT